ncbi:GCN5-related N-acetyltransferase [Shewanella sediminis HAW-EB3]|uniref:GCN5-related N-acetyltransferase n=1 Tax=Shewanella sediminis (strain HAW-EB3) TaxID=425104 RepID=A8FUA4_SHESH|nr:putative beta-lysine N-acetyltransferase [Shewanella sediminis]ABV36427.1 GCN5-related N-acetyltransferase [Shewanella sediminis HAW-EB3]
MNEINRSLFDTCDLLEGASIQYGPNSSRVYLMSMKQGEPTCLPAAMYQLAKAQGYGKLIAKVRQCESEHFFNHGFTEEARLPGYYPAIGQSEGVGECAGANVGEEAGEDALLLGAYLDSERQIDTKTAEHEKVLTLARNNLSKVTPAPDWQVIPLDEVYVEEMAHMYREVFPSYPFPIHEAGYLRETMSDNVSYFGIKHQGRLIALASAEQDLDNMAVEMTDFATSPEFRGQQLAAALLNKMESCMEQLGFRQAFTIARAGSVGMNRTFAKHGYHYQGRLINNTQISGQIESMNIWSKPLSPEC